MKAQINVSAPVLFSVGEYLNGAVLTAPQWVRSGAAEVDAAKAEALERDGYADIISKDGKPVAALVDARLFERIRRMQARFDALAARLVQGILELIEAPPRLLAAPGQRLTALVLLRLLLQFLAVLGQHVQGLRLGGQERRDGAVLVEPAQQGVARGQHVGGFGQQLGVQAGAGQRAAQFVADGQQQRALGVEHAVQAGGHAVDALGQLAELVAPPHRDGLREVARAVARHARVDRRQHPPA